MRLNADKLDAALAAQQRAVTLRDDDRHRLIAVIHAARVAHATLCDLQRDPKTSLTWYTTLDVQAAPDQLHNALLALERNKDPRYAAEKNTPTTHHAPKPR